MEKQDVLSQFEFYNTASDDFRRALREAAVLVRLADGDYYLREGDSCSQVALIGDGNIRVFKTGATGRQITLYHVSPGETCVLNASCILANKKSPATAQADGEVTVIVCPAPAFREWFNTEAGLRRFVFETVATRIASVMTLVEEIAFRHMDERVAEFLRVRFDGGDDVIALTHEQIASQLGTAREVISRILKDFERAGAIRLARGRIQLRDKGLLTD